MDSFYDKPRQAPIPTSIQKLTVTPLVPEISIYSNTRPQINNFVQHTFDSSIKHTVSTQNKENLPNAVNQSHILKKQVRFENPRASIEPKTCEKECRKPLTSNFQQIYLANVPNRQLDLTVLETNPKSMVNTDEEPKTYRDFIEKQKIRQQETTKPQSNCITDIFNYKSAPVERNSLILTKNIETECFLPQKSIYEPIFAKKPIETRDVGIQTDEQPQNNDSNVKDLLKIISQQNEQLLLLQQQVSTLINHEKQLINQKIDEIQAPTTSTQVEKMNNGIFSKFSIDLMTSFEVAVRKNQQNYGFQPKIQDISEECTVNSEQKGQIEPSIYFQDPINVVERCVSPEPSIKINMNDYDSSEDENETENIYENIMAQVNNILKKTQINSANQNGGENVQRNNQTMLRVKEATLKHLKTIGVSLPEQEISVGGEINSFENTGDFNSNEVSFAVKQLLMKYLPSKHLAKFAVKSKNVEDKVKQGLIQARPEFSFATVQYMKKYNLLQSNNNTGTHSNPKILDISKLKNQPKLL